MKADSDRPPKAIRRALREAAGNAYEAELRRALVELGAAFDEWREKRLSSGDLAYRIHRFHDGAARDLWKKYNYAPTESVVAHAIATGVVNRSAVSPDLLAYLQRAIRFYEKPASAGRQTRKRAAADPTLLAADGGPAPRGRRPKSGR